MTRLFISYMLCKNHGTAIEPEWEQLESCTILTMKEEIAQDILENEISSPYILLCGEVRQILEYMAEIQGYKYGGITSIEKV